MRQSGPPYAVHPSVAYVQAILGNLEKLTGRNLDGWVAAVKRQGPADLPGRRAWLKAEGLGSTQAWFVAERSLGASAHAFDDTAEGYLALAPQYVDRQYAGRKAALRPLAERLLALCRELGPEIRICPCETLIPIYRNHVIAQIKPFVARLDLGLALGDPAAVTERSPRLIETGGFRKKDRITHKLEIKAAGDIDQAVKGFLQLAFERDR
jgi:hypothetical protein